MTNKKAAFGRLFHVSDRVRAKPLISQLFGLGHGVPVTQSVTHGKGMTMTGTTPPIDVDLLYGVPKIATAMGLSEAQARHLCESGALPTFKLPGSRLLCARRSTLNAWLAEREAAARQLAPANA